MNNNSTIVLTTVIQRNDTQFLANKLGEEMVMMNMESGEFITMNNVGTDIWSLSEQPVSVSGLIQKLQQLYDITEDQCMKETIQFLEMSAGQNIFTIHNTATA